MAYVKYSDRSAEQRQAFRRSTDNYNKIAYDQVGFRVPKGTKNYIKEVADVSGMELADFIRTTLAEKMVELGFEDYAAALDPGPASTARSVARLNSLLDELAAGQTNDAALIVRKIRHTVGIMDNLARSLDAESGNTIIQKFEALPDDVINNKEELVQKIESLIEI